MWPLPVKLTLLTVVCEGSIVSDDILYLWCFQGLPHRVTEDDVYEGMFIPKGATIIPNTRCAIITPYIRLKFSSLSRGMTLDETVYKNATVFDPSRYFRGEPHPVAQFGFGRRQVNSPLTTIYRADVRTKNLSWEIPRGRQCLDCYCVHPVGVQYNARNQQ